MGKMDVLLNLVSCVYVKTRGPLFWELKVQLKNDEEEDRVIGYLKDVSRTMAFFCVAAQRFYKENPNSFYSPTIEHINKILMLDTIPMDFYEHIAIGTNFCDDTEEETLGDEHCEIES